MFLFALGPYSLDITLFSIIELRLGYKNGLGGNYVTAKRENETTTRVRGLEGRAEGKSWVNGKTHLYTQMIEYIIVDLNMNNEKMNIRRYAL